MHLRLTLFLTRKRNLDILFVENTLDPVYVFSGGRNSLFFGKDRRGFVQFKRRVLFEGKKTITLKRLGENWKILENY